MIPIDVLPFLTIVTNTVLIMILGSIWYSKSIGLGSLYITKYWGCITSYNVNCKPKQHTTQAFLITLVSTIIYSYLLSFVWKNMYAPSNMSELVVMAIVLVIVHLIMEMPHIGYEIRSYGAVMIHATFHFFMTLMALFVINYFDTILDFLFEIQSVQEDL